MSDEDFSLQPEPVHPDDATMSQRARDRHRALTINRMHMMYGVSPDEAQKCGACAFLTGQGGVAGRYYKCRKFRITRGPATDWRVRWRACGLFQERP